MDYKSFSVTDNNAPAEDYALWASGWGTDIGDRYHDGEPDGLANWIEYALGGDPTLDDASDILPAWRWAPMAEPTGSTIPTTGVTMRPPAVDLYGLVRHQPGGRPEQCGSGLERFAPDQRLRNRDPPHVDRWCTERIHGAGD